MITATVPSNVHQGRWGYYNCSYEDFLKIKLLHKHYWIAKRAEAADKRYYNKMPYNRVIRRQNKILLTKPIPMPVPFFPDIYSDIVKSNIVNLFQQARMPQVSQEMVKPLLIGMYQVRDWLSKIEEAYKAK